MNILEYIIRLLAPHNCLICGQEGDVLCQYCQDTELRRVPSRCYRCYKVSTQSRTCQGCRSVTGISHVWVVSPYDKTAKNIVYKLKFERTVSAAEDIARTISDILPILPSTAVVTHLPTVNKRVRIRGYDQAQKIAKRVAKNTGLRYNTMLYRKGRTRQVGSTRHNRFQQLRDAFVARKTKGDNIKHVLLVDDVLTTGASIESAAKTLRQSGVKTVDVAVFAQA